VRIILLFFAFFFLFNGEKINSLLPRDFNSDFTKKKTLSNYKVFLLESGLMSVVNWRFIPVSKGEKTRLLSCFKLTF